MRDRISKVICTAVVVGSFMLFAAPIERADVVVIGGTSAGVEAVLAAKGAKTLHFAAGATIGVKLGDREVSKDTPVISWDEDTQPDASVKFISIDRAEYVRFEVR